MIEDLSDESADKSRATVAIMRTHLANGETDKALAAVDDALSEDPENLNLKYARAVLRGGMGEFDEQIGMLREILAQEPTAVNVWMSLARAHGSQGDTATAEAVIDEALTHIPENANIRWAKASYLERRGEVGAAIDIYEDLYDASSSSIIAANNLASLLASYRETPETVERAYNIARRLRGLPEPAFQDTYGWIAFLRGDLEDALSHLEPAAEGLPNDPLVQYHLARVYEALDRPADAAEVYERAITILGNNENSAMQDASDRLANARAAIEN